MYTYIYVYTYVRVYIHPEKTEPVLDQSPILNKLNPSWTQHDWYEPSLNTINPNCTQVEHIPKNWTHPEN